MTHPYQIVRLNKVGLRHHHSVNNKQLLVNYEEQQFERSAKHLANS